MKITQEWIDKFIPNHERISCSDDNPNGNQYGGWNGSFSSTTGKKIIRFPRCVRCYLISHIDDDTKNMDFDVDVSVILVSNIE